MQHDNNEEQLDGDTIPLMLLTNNPTQDKMNFMEILYQAVAVGQVAFMDGQDPTTKEIVPLLVGVQPEANGKVSLYPLARIIKPDEHIKYNVPDGAGSYTSLDVGEHIDIGIDLTAGLSGNDSQEAARKAEGNGKAKNGPTIH